VVEGVTYQFTVIDLLGDERVGPGGRRRERIVRNLSRGGSSRCGDGVSSKCMHGRHRALHVSKVLPEGFPDFAKQLEGVLVRVNAWHRAIGRISGWIAHSFRKGI